MLNCPAPLPASGEMLTPAYCDPMPAPPNSAQQAASRNARAASARSSNDGAHRGRSPASPTRQAETRDAVKSGGVSAAKAKENQNINDAQNAGRKALEAEKTKNAEAAKKAETVATEKTTVVGELKRQLEFTIHEFLTTEKAAAAKLAAAQTVAQAVAAALAFERPSLPETKKRIENAEKVLAGTAPQRALDAAKFYMEKGFSKVQAAGFVGSLMQESYGDLRTKAVGDAGASAGVAQWQGTRREALNAFKGSGESIIAAATQPDTLGRRVATGIAGLLKSAIEGKPIKKEDIVQGGKEALIASIPGGPIMEFAGRLAMQKIQGEMLASKATTPEAVRTALGIAGMLPGGLGIMAQGIAGGVEIADPRPTSVSAKVQTIAERFGIKGGGKGKSKSQPSTKETGGADNLFAQRANAMERAFSQMSAPPTTATLAAAGFQNAAYDPTKPFSWSNNPLLSVNPAPDAGIIPKVTVDPTTPGPLTQMGFGLGWLTVEAGFALAALLLIAFGIWVMVRGKNSTNITVGEK